MIAKAGLGLVGLSAIGMGGVAFVKPEWLGINKEVPWTPLSQDHDFSTTKTSNYGESTFGGKYKGVLTGVVGTKSDENTNEGWWKKAFEKLKIDSGNNKVSDKFKHDSVNKNNSKVDTWISDSNGKGLNQVCNTVYKTEDSKIKEPGSGTDEYKETDVWKYCSPLGSKPKTIKEASQESTYSSGTIGNNSSNTSKLVSTTGNEKFWELRDKEFKGIGKYQKIEAEKDDFFDPGKNKTIRDLCEDAYKKTGVSSGNSTKDAPKSDKAIKYCSINKE